MTDLPSRIEDRCPDGGLSLGAVTEELTIRRFRRPDGQIEPEVGGDGLVQAVSPTLAELASKAGLSVFHFTRAFRETFGLSRYRYLLRRRLGQARDMLVTGETNLHLISRGCGFSSVPHLTNAFSREMGIPPARFRRVLREVEQAR